MGYRVFISQLLETIPHFYIVSFPGFDFAIFANCKSLNFLEFFKEPFMKFYVFRMNWTPRVELTASGHLHIPLVNIHLLSNIDILNDFAARVVWWEGNSNFFDCKFSG